jgi:N-acetylglutamate synthase-like GNAT family acetyltransferase
MGLIENMQNMACKKNIKMVYKKQLTRANYLHKRGFK